MPNFGNCQILARDWLLANSCCQSHKKLPKVGNFCFCQMLAYQILAMPNVGSILWLRTERIRKKLRKQGVRGPRPTLFYGNTQEMKRIRQEAVSARKQDTSNYISTLFPHFLIWRETYGMWSKAPSMHEFFLQ